jgi:5'-3' exonuclease
LRKAGKGEMRLPLLYSEEFFVRLQRNDWIQVLVPLKSELIVLREFLEKHGMTCEQLVDLAILVGTDFNQGVKGIRPKKASKLIRVHGRLENLPDKIKIRLAGNYEEVRRVFLEPDLYGNYGISYGELQEQGAYDFLCEKRDFSRERAASRAHYKAFKSEQKTVYGEGISARPEELETIVPALRELGLSYEELSN